MVHHHFFLEENMLETCKKAIADEKLLWFIEQMQQPSDTSDIFSAILLP